MNTKIYKQVLFFADHLMAAAQEQDQSKFDGFYAELKQLCEENENTDKDHPCNGKHLLTLLMIYP
jgi:hypothetical protein